MKRKRFLVVVLLVLAAMLGCDTSRQESFDFDTSQFYASFKPQDDDAYGKKTACYDDRIYYLSDESGTQGVHSMRPDGSDVCLELETEDIRSIQITEDAVWLVGYIGVRNIYRDFWWRYFQPFRVDRKTGEVTRLSETLPFKQAECLADSNVWQAYAFPDGTVALRKIGLLWGGRPKPCMFLLRDGKLLQLPKKPDYDLKLDGRDSSDHLPLWMAGDLLLCNSYSFVEDCCELASDTLLHMKDGRQPFRMDTFLRYTTSYTETPIFAKDGVVYFHCNDAIEVFDSEKETMRTLMQATDGEPIRIALPSADGTKLLLLAQTWTRRPQQLYRTDLTRGESQLLLRLPRSAAFVYLDETRAIAAKGKKLLFYDLTGEQAEQTGTMELSTRIVDRRNKVECAGGWLFLYRFNDKTMRDELVEKVRIG